MTPLPPWVSAIAEVLPTARAEQFTRVHAPSHVRTRDAAVLMLFGEGGRGGDLLLIERAATLRSHPGQAAFPGGAVDAEDASPVVTALREAEEETGLDPDGVQVLGLLPQLFLPPSQFVVTPVVGWWREPNRVEVRDPAEVARVERVALEDLLDPANRWTVRHPSGLLGPAFTVNGLFVWGFTAGLLSRLLALAGLERPWDESRLHALPGPVLGASRPARAPGDVPDDDPGPDVAEEYEDGEVEP